MDANLMNKMNAGKQKEADSEYKKGKAALKTGLLKWKPDHLSASMNFERAAICYRDIGNEIMAKDAFLKYAVSSEALDMLSGAADAYSQAAMLENDFQASQQMLKKCQELYLIEGKGERGITSIKKCAKKMAEDYEKADVDDPGKLQRIINMYKSIYSQIFENEDYYVFNQDVIDDYMNLLLTNDLFFEAIEARKVFINYLIKSKTIDHQIRRAYLEYLCLVILTEEKFKLKNVLQEFIQNVPSAFKEQEYQFAEQMQTAVFPGGNEDQDWIGVRELMKKPIWNFLNNEIVKKVKIMAMQKINEQENQPKVAQPAGPAGGQGNNQIEEQKINEDQKELTEEERIAKREAALDFLC